MKWHLDPKYTKSVLTLIVLLLLVVLIPNTAIDPWHILNPKKIITLLFALALIQILGSTVAQIFGAKLGSILMGFVGGLVSSTATTAAISKQSKLMTNPSELSVIILTFLSATLAMLFEGLMFLAVGAHQIESRLLILFIMPMIATGCMIFYQAKQLNIENLNIEKNEFKIIPLLKLAAFITAVLALSKTLQLFFGDSGLSILTFLVSLFEIHGSVISNIQLFEGGNLSSHMLGNLFVISIIASYVSKVFLVFTLGSQSFQKQVLIRVGIVFLVIILSWVVTGSLV